MAAVGASSGDGPSRQEELRASARGWHGVQLAIIGFIGFCGVIQDGRPDNPDWLQVLSGILALTALVLACLATFLVARVAWPLYGAEPRPLSGEPAEIARDSRRLRRGLILTFAALATLALGNAAGWWPQDDEGAGDAAAASAVVQVQAVSGERVCGSLRAARAGTLGVSAAGRSVVVPLRAVASVRPVDGC